MVKSEQINELALALAKAQAVIKHPKKQSTVNQGKFSYHYADLATLIDCAKDALGANGLSIAQIPSSSGRTVTVTTVLLHASGQFIEGLLTLDAIDGKPQSIGSAITYARRYAYGAMIGVASEDDDDAVLAQGTTDAKVGARPASVQAAKPPLLPTASTPKVLTFDRTSAQHVRKLHEALEKRGVELDLYDPITASMHGKIISKEMIDMAIDQAATNAIPF